MPRTRTTPAATTATAASRDLGATVTLKELLSTATPLTSKQRELIVVQARSMIEGLYVHLPLKRAMHATNPIQRLRLLQVRQTGMSDRQFQDEMISIFTELRDLHTNYVLPDPFRTKTAFLPFLIEEFFEADQREYVVSKTFAGFTHPNFRPGVVLTYWNGVPIDRAVEVNADAQAGSNTDARHARGLEAMTIRPLALSAPPDEEWVVVGYTANGTDRQVTIEWQIFEPPPSSGGVDLGSATQPQARVLGIDARTEAVRRAKKALFAPKAMEAERQTAPLRSRRRRRSALEEKADEFDTTSTMPDAFAFKPLTTTSGTFGYIRIWTFNVADADAFVQEFVRIARLLPQDGLIIDVRGNGGGNILAGEHLLQVLTPRPIDPERLHFINTPMTLRLCETTDFVARWKDSIAQAVETGATFSQGFPLEPIEEYNRLGQQYCGPVVLITDALCYSTTDIFTAGFQDHGIGPILGASGNTGAGGANVWSYELLRQVLPGDFPALPKNASFRVAIRQTTRVGEHSGVPLEDLGVVPDERHLLTKNDVLGSNEDLLAKTVEILAGMKVYGLEVAPATASGGELPVVAATRNLTRVDALVDGRPQATVDVSDGANAFTVPDPGTGTHTLELKGFDGDELAASKRLQL